MGRIHPEIYFFGAGVAEGRAEMRNLLGGKGANLAEMARLKLPVPPGFTISTKVCNYFYDHAHKYPKGLTEGVAKSVARVEKALGRKFGDAKNPLLVSVRSGARVSMPGMMDTVLNLGLTDETVKGLTEISGSARFAWDSYRRFCQMFGDVVLKLKPENKNDPDPFEEIIDHKKAARGVTNDTDLNVDDLQQLVAEFRALIRSRVGRDIPQDQQYPGRLGHRRHRAIDGVRQPGRRLRDRRRIHARSRHRREGNLRRVPAQRAGRGRCRGHSHWTTDQPEGRTLVGRARGDRRGRACCPILDARGKFPRRLQAVPENRGPA